ncbi:MAG: hypothetical protein IJ787_05805 [Bacilli bacterium]|nr:hypothetical protein [Bacilli bacterium]
MKSFILKNLLNFIAAGLLVIVDVLYIALNNGDHTFVWLTFILALVAAAILSLGAFAPKFLRPYVPLLASFAMAFAFANEFYVTLETLSDVWNGVTFIGGNATMGVTFTILFFLLAVVVIVSCFRKDNKEEAK